ncbi:hypothetical protein F5Y19DRAFT_23277 [Xylariaceae sp. FL1651]|nr:hypothetical protein F5Y19DRAFT_23277 [Xylariaceae sp. FL1651]
MAAGKETCQHEVLLLECSPWAEEAGFERPDAAKRLAATTKTGRNPLSARGKSVKTLKKLSQNSAEQLCPSFPGPLLLPKDELNWEPDYPPQSFRSWLINLARNKPTPERRTIYVAAAPTVTPSVSFMNGWTQPTTAAVDDTNRLEPPPADASIQYLRAFYYGLDVKPFPQQLQFVSWIEDMRHVRPDNDISYVGLADNYSCTRIRTRIPPDKKFEQQLNLNDVLDATIRMLPDDAYAIVLLMNFDMYEDVEDDFCCGRAYGGSRVCVVSSARYHPALDTGEGIDYQHMWPTSHCMRFVDEVCAIEGLKPQEHKKTAYGTQDSPLQQAVEASRMIATPSTVDELRGLWFSRVARTVAHELGHCVGLDHCIYYACSMQGTAGIAEDVRQPPYLCPVCLVKVAYAIACELQGQDNAGMEKYIKERYRTIAEFCSAWKHVGFFASYGAWVLARLQQI